MLELVWTLRGMGNGPSQNHALRGFMLSWWRQRPRNTESLESLLGFFPLTGKASTCYSQKILCTFPKQAWSHNMLIADHCAFVRGLYEEGRAALIVRLDSPRPQTLIRKAKGCMAFSEGVPTLRVPIRPCNKPEQKWNYIIRSLRVIRRHPEPFEFENPPYCRISPPLLPMSRDRT